MPKRIKMKRAESVGPSPGGSPKFTTSSGGKATTFRTPAYKKVKRLKTAYSTYKNRNYRGD
tara:strand:+ start:1402 stop:1584 length:183 start_codon:yes stop_codon:yes gene_type:complete